MYAYKTTLQERFLDPDILYASSAYAVAVAALMARSSPQGAAELASKAKEAQNEARAALKGADSVPSAGEVHERTFRPQFERSRQEKRSVVVRKVRNAKRPQFHDAPRSGPPVFRILVLVAVIAGGLFYVRYAAYGHAQYLTLEEATHLPQWVLQGTLSGTAPRRAFIGEASGATWNSWDEEERERAVASLRRTLASDFGVSDALIQVDRSPIIMIQEGKVVLSR
jgi:hypothetical protein